MNPTRTTPRRLRPNSLCRIPQIRPTDNFPLWIPHRPRAAESNQRAGGGGQGPKIRGEGRVGGVEAGELDAGEGALEEGAGAGEGAAGGGDAGGGVGGGPGGGFFGGGEGGGWVGEGGGGGGGGGGGWWGGWGGWLAGLFSFLFSPLSLRILASERGERVGGLVFDRREGRGGETYRRRVSF